MQHSLDLGMEFMGTNITQMILVVYRSGYWTAVRVSVAGARSTADISGHDMKE